MRSQIWGAWTLRLPAVEKQLRILRLRKPQKARLAALWRTTLLLMLISFVAGFSHATLVPWSEVALFGADLVAAIVAIEVDGAEGTVVFEVRRRVGKRVLAA